MKVLKPYRVLLTLVGLSAIFFLWSCYPDSGLTSIEDYDLVVTQYDPEQDFSEFSTYAMPDSVIHLVGEGKEDEINRDYDEQILAQVERNMNDLNYTRIFPGDPGTADIILTVYATSTQWKGYSWVGGGGYWDWWGYPGYPWYPYYPGYAVPYEFTTGTVLIEMGDVNDYDPEQDRLPIRWGAGINGLLDDSKTNIQYRLTRNIDQCFTQSPYLGRPE